MQKLFDGLVFDTLVYENEKLWFWLIRQLAIDERNTVLLLSKGKFCFLESTLPIDLISKIYMIDKSVMLFILFFSEIMNLRPMIIPRL